MQKDVRTEYWVVKTRFKIDHNLGEIKLGKLSVHISHIRDEDSEDKLLFTVYFYNHGNIQSKYSMSNNYY